MLRRSRDYLTELINGREKQVTKRETAIYQRISWPALISNEKVVAIKLFVPTPSETRGNIDYPDRSESRAGAGAFSIKHN